MIWIEDIAKGLQGRSILSNAQLSHREAKFIIDVAEDMKAKRNTKEAFRFEYPTSLALIFEKPSLRTRVTFERAMFQMGGEATFLRSQEIQMGARETVKDIASNLSRWVEGIAARVYKHKTLELLDQASTIPVINGLCDIEHPCQSMADMLTVKEHLGGYTGKQVTYVGDGNNVCHSLLLMSGLLGLNMTVACPEGYEPQPYYIETAKKFGEESGAVIQIVNDPIEGVQNADAVYTDVWASMGQEDEAEERKKVMRPYQLNQKLLDKAKPGAVAMHCLPAHRGEEITDEVLDGPRSVTLDQAENRLHAQKALIRLLLSKE